ncbi:zinc finger protein 507 [Odontesthes bonariensis]|uniref:zinc finger protein 507-like n=1 Tax=Odontesthes bonariensis TaxID=219752 RepID=UPI003F58954A
MDENSSVVVLSSAASSSSSTASVLGSHPQIQTQLVIDRSTPTVIQQKQADDSLIQVIEKLSKIVDKRPQRQKRGLHLASSVGAKGGEQGFSSGGSPKKIKKNCNEGVRTDGSEADGTLSSPASGDSNNNSIASTLTEEPCHSNNRRTVTCYQCSLCPYLSQTLPQLKEHLKQHNEQHSDLILMCSECHFTSRDQAQLEAHVRLHFDEGGNMKGNSPHLDPCTEGQGESLRKQDRDGDHCRQGTEMLGSSVDGSKELPQKKKWYSFEEYGLYRCLICSYVCSQQRMLKTHAWKHAGLVDCSYPIFEGEEGGSTRREVQAAVNSVVPREDLVVFSPVLQDKSLQKLPAAFKLQLCMPVAVENKQDALNPPDAKLSESPESPAEEDENVYPIKDVSSEEPMVEVQVTTEADTEVDMDDPHNSTSVADSLLSSAQKIINSSPNSAGHINVIVERLPSAEDSVIVTKPLLLSPDVDSDKSLLDVKEGEPDHVGDVKDEVVLSCGPDEADSQPFGGDMKSSVTKSNESPRDENIPPAGRKRTHSESLRLHSLAAEALVAMPMRMPELPTSSAKVSLRTVSALVQSPHMDQKLFEVTKTGQNASDTGASAPLLDLELRSEGREENLESLSAEEGDEESPATNAGISLSLLTVIERLRERSDQNASDEDILKELQDNAQFQNGSVAGVVPGNGAESYVCSIPGMDGLVGSPDGGLVDYIPGSERPYRCRMCRYSSGNKGYIKQHLRVHKQRQPYQCPICEHKASDSKDLENHMIHHCKTRMYQCKQCPDAFHYKSQLRSHEREHHSFSSDVAALTETISSVEESDRGTDEDCCTQKMYKCDVCNYTSSTYVGVRNHRRIHNSDKPYRCCSCDFATTNMNSLKSHMRRHPQEHQAVQLLEQYRCSLCGYVCSHPPSLKSHMWKHAGDQNYNYEQVNKAINEAISQSSRAPQKLSAVLESVTECPVVAQCSKDQAKGPVEPPSTTATATKAALSIDSAAPPSTPPADPSRCPSEPLSPLGKDPAQPQFQNHPRTGQFPVPGPSMEYCVLLFCCCICGFESTSKERLMEHMKEHEGDIISIILNKEQQQPGAQASLQTAE